MKKRLLSAVLALVLCAYPAMAADFGTMTISPDREVIDDSYCMSLPKRTNPARSPCAHRTVKPAL